MNLLPAVLVGGPPHAGKSVLFYRLTRALREQGSTTKILFIIPLWLFRAFKADIILLRRKNDGRKQASAEIT